jgi:lambda repressor-like predicted transcriptional regulator
MATTTPNYGWAVPTSTDLVKDGATAIETLGDSIDASMFTALGTKKAGMVLLNTTSFSGVATQTINNVFSATYDTYQIIVSNLTGATAGNLYLRFTVGGTANTDVVFNIENLVVDSASVASSAYTAAEYVLGAARTTVSQITTLVSKPFTAAPKSLWSSGGGAGKLNLTTANYGNSISFDGFRLLADAATMSGTVTTLGVNK